MTSIGSFGAAIRELDPDGEKDTFDFFGETFTIEGVIPSILMIHLGAVIAGKVGRYEAHAAFWQALRCALSVPERDQDGKLVAGDESQFEGFYRLAIQKRCDEDSLIDLVLSILGLQAGKAETQQPTSPDGSSSTSTSSSSSASDSPDSGSIRSVEDRLLNG